MKAIDFITKKQIDELQQNTDDNNGILDVNSICKLMDKFVKHKLKNEWKNPIFELPKETKEVIVYFENKAGFHTTGVVFDFKTKLFYDNYHNDYKAAYNSRIIAWCELPTFNNNK